MEKQELIYGIRAIIEAIETNRNIDKLFIQKEAKGDLIKELLFKVKQKNIAFTYVPQEKLNRLTQKNHQGAVATISPVLFEIFETLAEKIISEKEKPIFLLLDQISDARNFGAILRTAVCTGVDAVIIPKQGAAAINGDTIKTSAGGVFKIPICKVEHLKDAIYFLQGSSIKVVAATEKTTSTLFESDFNMPIAIILGAEDKGINPSILKIVDEKLKLPIIGDLDSLNVSVACGAFLYEIVRQQKKF